ncbi:MAG: 50S ribosomal protein L11 methyltransferase [Desulfobacteraceae bacterium]|nr:50S ribosomal protein L11 methyltransferase [Desulfobacteraceae bacterium]
MQFKKVIAQFDAENILLAEELICDIFFSFKLKGVVCDVPIDEPDEGFGTNTLPKIETYSITGFLPLIDSSDIILKGIKEKAARLIDFDIKVDIKTQVVDEKDWADAWKQYFHVTQITDKITIKPAWKGHVARPDEIVIHLDPGMAFGTGTHPTTAMCIKLIERHLRPGSTFLDIGTGSGILMIAAAKLGAGYLLGIDNDEVAIKVSQKNLLKNDIDTDRVDLKCATLDLTDSKPFNFIAANIIAQVIVNILPLISARAEIDTIIVLSGIIKERLNDVVSALKANNLLIIDKEYQDEWVTLAVKRKT